VAVDHLSGGRLIPGAGSGAANHSALSAVGEPMSTREPAARLDEGLELLTALWTGEPVRHHGPYYRLDDLHLPAVPVQRPRIPVWIGGDLSRPGTRRRLTRWDGACVYRPGSRAEIFAK
jgi:alkanesulfonate monooxygenase SsuD/methylene tetrahydromethanopterin reductase-like flavin-dependent oxidoreductase (luciferase family)